MGNKCVVFLEGQQAYDQCLGVDYELLNKLKEFFWQEGVAVEDMLFTGKTYTEQIIEANTRLNDMETNEKHLRLMIYFMQ